MLLAPTSRIPMRNVITEPTIYKLMMMLRNGGKIVSSRSCTPDEWQLGIREKRIFLDDDGNGYIYMKEGLTK